MNTPIHSSKRDGFIIVVSLTLMLVMMTMGIGLYYSTKQSSELVGKGITKSDSFYSAESCIAEARLWLKKESKAGAPCKNTATGALCHSVSSARMSKWQLASEAFHCSGNGEYPGATSIDIGKEYAAMVKHCSTLAKKLKEIAAENVHLCEVFSEFGDMFEKMVGEIGAVLICKTSPWHRLQVQAIHHKIYKQSCPTYVNWT